MRSASRANSSFGRAAFDAVAGRPVRHDSQVPWIWSTLWRGVKLRAAATSSSSASMSELRNSNERLQVLQIR